MCVPFLPALVRSLDTNGLRCFPGLAYHILGAALALVKVGQARARERLLRPRTSVLTLLERGNLACYVVYGVGHDRTQPTRCSVAPVRLYAK